MLCPADLNAAARGIPSASNPSDLIGLAAESGMNPARAPGEPLQAQGRFPWGPKGRFPWAPLKT